MGDAEQLKEISATFALAGLVHIANNKDHAMIQFLFVVYMDLFFSAEANILLFILR